MFNLGVYLEEGRGGLAASPGEAATWYRKAAKGGHTDAQYSLAAFLLARLESSGDRGGAAHELAERIGSDAARDEALVLLGKAAGKGHALSRRRLAELTGDVAMAAAAAKDHTLVSHPKAPP
jgi:TPR repeat protein